MLLHLVGMGTLPSVKPGGILGGMHRSRPCSCRPRARSVVRKESNQVLGSQELIGFMGSHFFLVRTRVKASYTQACGYHRFECFRGASLSGAQSEVSPARLGKERETPLCFHARAIIPLTAQPLLFYTHSLSSHSSSHSPPPNRWMVSLPPPRTAPTKKAPLHRRLAVPCIIVGEQASLHRLDFNHRLLCNVVRKSPSIPIFYSQSTIL
jgi:hypothetical protein